jgi:large subunit ribosomal protein L17
MRHSNANRKFNRTKNQRNALLKALAVSLIQAEKIQTSEPKAKELRPHIEKIITLAKKGTLASYRLVIKAVGPAAGKKMFTEIAPRFKDRKGGYTRITKLIARKGDASPRAHIEFI